MPVNPWRISSSVYLNIRRREIPVRAKLPAAESVILNGVWGNPHAIFRVNGRADRRS